MTVFEQQCYLGILGYLGAGKQDGVYGAVTAYAIKQFQHDYGLTVDGDCGQMTEKMMRGVIAGTVAKKETVQNILTQYQTSSNQTGTFWDSIKYFTPDEENITCPCPRCRGKTEYPEQRLMQEADGIRETAGNPMIPSSVRRCQAHNDELDGSAPNSYHVRGLAMDFDIPALADSHIKTILDSEKAAGRVRYWYQMKSGWFHFDVN